MDDREVELSHPVLVPNSDSSSSVQASISVDSFLDELLRNAQTCTHTHTCNPPGPDAAHTHTCYHTHTQVIPSERVENPSEKVDGPCDSRKSTSKTRRSSGNREAVRKYREKKKAQTAYLEEEAKKLRLVNQQLIRKVQRQAILEAEISRLRSLLLDVRGKIDIELGAYPLQKQCTSSTKVKEGDSGRQFSGLAMELQCENDLTCFHPHGDSSIEDGGFGGCDKMGASSWEGNCQSATVACKANGRAERNGMDSVETRLSSASQAE
ncbi:basic leucine zipper 19-like [Coffea arabica]|uniref:Basic leucine zipper 23-like n=1 Tax=Coffea arabica TaxID=13443 RepID=A0A6P6WJM6_COFAR|nr:basic leucine zipper 23-like [Coffea arabica]XP_027113957.1 basic leucine zipper 23-like [Coffea arabica]